jgi:hypothetical protein
MIIEYGLGNYDSIQDKFLYMPDKVSEWCIINKYNVYKLSDTSEIRDIIKNISDSQNVKNVYTHFYHTTNWSSAENIIENGPQFFKGRKCLDFGIFPSFYVTPDINTSIEWCEYKRLLWKNEVVIIIFSIPTSKLRSYKKFENADEEWKMLTKSSRLCKDKRNNLDNYNFVYGPMVANPNKIRYDNETPQPHNNIKWQLASKNNSSDKFLKKYLSHVIIL